MPVSTPLSLNNIVNEFGMSVIVGATQTFDSGSNTVTAPAGAGGVRIKVWGGGGSGYSDLNTFFGGGAGGGFTVKTINVIGGISQFTYSVGGRGENGNSGGTSTVTSGAPSVSLTATGGGGASVNPNAYGTGSGGDVNKNGQAAVGNVGGDAGGVGWGGGRGNADIDPGAGGYGDENGFTSGGTGRIVFEWLSPALSGYTRGDGTIANHAANVNIPELPGNLAISQFSGAEKSFSANMTVVDISPTQKGYLSGIYGSINRNQVGINEYNLATTTLVQVVETKSALYDLFGNFMQFVYPATVVFTGDVRPQVLGYNLFSSIIIDSGGEYDNGGTIETSGIVFDGTYTYFTFTGGLFYPGFYSSGASIIINYDGP